MSTRTACVVAGATPDEVAAIGAGDDIQMRVNRHGTLVTGRPGGRVIDYAAELAGPVYDVMYNPDTGWFVVTVYRQLIGSPVKIVSPSPEVAPSTVTLLIAICGSAPK